MTTLTLLRSEKMTSMLPEEEAKATKMKQKLMNNDVHGKEEVRSFLSFSRENLSISQSELEQGFNKYRYRPNRNTILSVVALSIALLCLALESWKFHWSMVNAQEIEELKRSVENLKNCFMEKKLLEGLKAFEKQLYPEEPNDDDDPGEADIDNADYDSNYEETGFSSHDYSLDYHTPPTYGSRPSDFPDFSSSIAPAPSPPDPAPNEVMMQYMQKLMKLEKFESKQDSEKNPRESHRKANREQHQPLPGKSHDQTNDTRGKREISDDKDSTNWSGTPKSRRSINEQHKKPKFAMASNEEQKGINHSRMKYYSRTAIPEAFALTAHNSSIANQPKKPARRLRKNLNVLSNSTAKTRIFYAAHFVGNKYGNMTGDENKGNGRICPGNRVFKAWTPSPWMHRYGMDEHIRMASDNSNVTVCKSGLYLVYAQIFYKDEHDEVGFHLEVNEEPVMQCVINNSRNPRNSGHANSQSCFSAQLVSLKKEDVLVLKEVGASKRCAIFEKEKSFFGLVNLAELE